jgi:hypothetical protein
MTREKRRRRGMKEPRLLRSPNGGLLNVDVTLLQIGLSRCRCIAEDGLVELQRKDLIDTQGILNEIVEEVRKTLWEMGDAHLDDEVGEILAQEN